MLLADDLLTDAGEKTDDSATKRSTLPLGLEFRLGDGVEAVSFAV